VLKGFEDFGLAGELAGAITGYFADADQVEVVAAFMERWREAGHGFYLLDPVMGDDGRLYVDDTLVEAIRNRLLPLADFVTPNACELGWLAGTDVDGIDTALEAANALLARLPSCQGIAAYRCARR